MDFNKRIDGFSKLSKMGKIKWIAENFFTDPDAVIHELSTYWHNDEDQQKIIDGFSENTISNFYMPYGIAPNFVINGKAYAIPMVIEESSVVAAASSAAKFWMDRGGFTTQIIDVEKVGHVTFKWHGSYATLINHSDKLNALMKSNARSLTENMERRGGGIRRIEYIDLNLEMPNFFQIRVHFDTCDSMGANFINSVLESFSETLEKYFLSKEGIEDKERDADVVLAILSNYTPRCIAKAWVSCPIENLGTFGNGTSAHEFAQRFYEAVRIAQIDPYRATTHNKGIYNGIDAVVIATGNDFRAIEAAGHAYAARSGQYSSLSNCKIENDTFYFELEVPLALGTIGGLTALHPISRRSLELLGNPNSKELMSIVAVTGLAQNFAAIRSLVTTGIQKGHMKMHLQNILIQLKANAEETALANAHFANDTISFQAVRSFLEKVKQNKA
jgi:hydroxymethylglutaryl-CoA reductase